MHFITTVGSYKNGKTDVFTSM